MQVIQQAFSHSASSFMIKKIDGSIVDVLYAPLSAGEVTFAIIFSAVSRSIMIAFISIIVFYFVIEIVVRDYFILIMYTFLSSFILGATGMIAGLWAEKFDHMATVTNFIIVPLSFLSGTFYTIDRLPNILQIISKANPFFYMIDGFRYGFIDKADSSIFIGLIYLSILSVVLWFVSYILLKNGYKTKS
jgi:ABC-2 type transport system permease protein